MDGESKEKSADSIRALQGREGKFHLQKWRFRITQRVIILTGEGGFIHLICKFVFSLLFLQENVT